MTFVKVSLLLQVACVLAACHSSVVVLGTDGGPPSRIDEPIGDPIVSDEKPAFGAESLRPVRSAFGSVRIARTVSGRVAVWVDGRALYALRFDHAGDQLDERPRLLAAYVRSDPAVSDGVDENGVRVTWIYFATCTLGYACRVERLSYYADGTATLPTEQGALEGGGSVNGLNVDLFVSPQANAVGDQTVLVLTAPPAQDLTSLASNHVRRALDQHVEGVATAFANGRAIAAYRMLPTADLVVRRFDPSGSCSGGAGCVRIPDTRETSGSPLFRIVSEYSGETLFVAWATSAAGPTGVQVIKGMRFAVSREGAIAPIDAAPRVLFDGNRGIESRSSYETLASTPTSSGVRIFYSHPIRVVDWTTAGEVTEVPMITSPPKTAVVGSLSENIVLVRQDDGALRTMTLAGELGPMIQSAPAIELLAGLECGTSSCDVVGLRGTGTTSYDVVATEVSWREHSPPVARGGTAYANEVVGSTRPNVIGVGNLNVWTLEPASTAQRTVHRFGSAPELAYESFRPPLIAKRGNRVVSCSSLRVGPSRLEQDAFECVVLRADDASIESRVTFRSGSLEVNARSLTAGNSGFFVVHADRSNAHLAATAFGWDGSIRWNVKDDASSDGTTAGMEWNDGFVVLRAETRERSDADARAILDAQHVSANGFGRRARVTSAASLGQVALVRDDDGLLVATAERTLGAGYDRIVGYRVGVGRLTTADANAPYEFRVRASRIMLAQIVNADGVAFPAEYRLGAHDDGFVLAYTRREHDAADPRAYVRTLRLPPIRVD